MIFLQIDVSQGLDVAKGVSEYGFMVVVSGFFILLCSVILFTIVKRYMKMTDENMKGSVKMMQSIADTLTSVARKIDDISEAEAEKNLTQIKTIAMMAKKYDVEFTMNMIRRIRTDNHLNEKEKLAAKVSALCKNLAMQRGDELSLFMYRGKPLDEYMPQSWHFQIEKTMLADLDMEESYSRTYSNMRNAFDSVFNLFVENLKK